jgi:hypothetical protein
LVVDSRDSDKYKVTETNIIPFLINTIKELSKEIEDLKSKI